MTVPTDTAGAWEPTPEAVDAAFTAISAGLDTSLKGATFNRDYWLPVVRKSLIAAHAVGEGGV